MKSDEVDKGEFHLRADEAPVAADLDARQNVASGIVLNGRPAQLQDLGDPMTGHQLVKERRIHRHSVPSGRT